MTKDRGNRYCFREPQKMFFFNGSAIEALTPSPPPPSSLMAIGRFLCWFFFRLKIAEKNDWQFFPLHNFWTRKAIFFGIYFRKPVKDCEFADRQHILTEFLIFWYVVLSKIYLIFQRFFSLMAHPFIPPPYLSLNGTAIKKSNFFYGFPYYLFSSR